MHLFLNLVLRPICIPQLAKARNALTCSSGSLQSRATSQPAWNIQLKHPAKRRCRGLPTAPELPYLHLHPTPTSSKTCTVARALSESVVTALAHGSLLSFGRIYPSHPCCAGPKEQWEIMEIPMHAATQNYSPKRLQTRTLPTTKNTYAADATFPHRR